MKSLLIAALLTTCVSAFATEPTAGTMKPAVDPAKKEELKADRESVNNACSSESSKAGCGSEKVGTGLLRCIHAYKKAHKDDFKISDGCKSALEKLRADRHSK